MMNKLLKHSNPFSNESLESYLYRLSIENMCDIKWIYDLFKLRYRTYKETPNELKYSSLIQRIANYTNNSYDRIKKMTIYNYNIWDNDNIYTRKFLTTYYSKYCPICLKEEKYHRIYWHIKEIYICLIHNVVLMNKCPECFEKITTKNVIKGFCSCGQNLMDTGVKYCDNHNIKYYQEGVYNSYGIKLEGIEIRNLDFLSLEAPKYIDFISTLQMIIYENMETIKKVKNDVDTNSDKDLEAYKYTTKMLNNWPQSFHDFIENLNEYNIDRYEKTDGILKSQLLNPIMCVLISDKYSVEHIKNIKLINKELIKIFIEQYLSFLRKLFDNQIINKHYIYSVYIRGFLQLNHEHFLNNLSIFEEYYFEGEMCFKIDEVLNFFKTYINESKILNKDENIGDFSPINLFIYLFSRLNISFNDIFKIIQSHKIDVYINPYCKGIDVLWVSTKEMKKAILKECIRRVDQDDIPMSL